MKLAGLCLLAILLGACSTGQKQVLVPARETVSNMEEAHASEDKREVPDTETRKAAPPAPISSPPSKKGEPEAGVIIREQSRPVPTPPVVFDLIDKASAALYLQRWREAQRLLEQAQRIAPNEPQVYLFYGDYYFEQDQFARARAMYERALSLSSEGSETARQSRYRLNKVQAEQE